MTERTQPGWEAHADLVIVGTGVAGLTAALAAGRRGLRALVVTKEAADQGSTALAQGGVAVVLPDGHDPTDSPTRHADDTITAGAGLCDPTVVSAIVTQGPAALARLRARGASFDRDMRGRLARTREGGHGTFRVVRAGGDATGAEVERTLLTSTRRRGCAILERHLGVRVLRGEGGTVAGLAVVDDRGRLGMVRAPAVVLATGGIGQLYRATTNPAVATGDGLALALRAGAEVADLEFVQFHPTVLFTGAETVGRRPLVTEAVRGEGAVLVDAAGQSVMESVHPRGDLAPRDVVSAAITRRLSAAPAGVDDHVYLDATGLPGFADRFPTVYAACVAAGIDPRKDPIPVAPAAHFACGGVVTTADGRSQVPGLYAVGEVARTGLHGANRLASNSLLEGLVMGERVADAVAADRPVGDWLHVDMASEPIWRGSAGSLGKAAAVERGCLQDVMSRHVGIGRDASGLARAASVPTTAPMRELRQRSDHEDAALRLVAEALIESATIRVESRGCHVRHDHPRRDDASWQHSVAVRLDSTGRMVRADRPGLGGAA